MAYPEEYSRVNCLCDDYAEIAFRNYISVKQRYLYYKNAQDFDILNESILIMQNSIVSVVFAQMAIESFFNDYAAACLGDDEFYENFDKLDCIGKFQLIGNFILQERIDKGKEPYTCLKTLIKMRNKYTHNKSLQFDVSKYNGYSHCNDDIPIENIYQARLVDCRETLNEAIIGIKAMIAIANYFDEFDQNVRAYFSFFGFVKSSIDLDAANVKRELKELGLKNEIQI